jgi:hypothetical protein
MSSSETIPSTYPAPSATICGSAWTCSLTSAARRQRGSIGVARSTESKVPSCAGNTRSSRSGPLSTSGDWVPNLTTSLNDRTLAGRNADPSQRQQRIVADVRPKQSGNRSGNICRHFTVRSWRKPLSKLITDCAQMRHDCGFSVRRILHPTSSKSIQYKHLSHFGLTECW